MLARPLGIALVCLLALAAACGSGTSTPVLAGASKTSVITGTATPCVGLTTLGPYDKLPVRVTLETGSQVAAHQSGHGTMTFRFSVAPGQFQVSSDQSGTSPVGVAVQSGKTTRVDLKEHCK